MNSIRSRRFRGLVRAVFAGACFALVNGFSLEPAHLPIYLEDSHAGSFYWFAENLPLNEEVTLVLFDAHSDASQLFDSDAAYRAIRDTRDRPELLRKWRERGLVQCFDWIEPLMPKPFHKVIWVAPDEFDLEKCRAEIAREIHAHDAAMPRKRDSLDGRFEVVTLDQLEVEGPFVVSLDLDYFAECSSSDLGEAFGRVWNEIFEHDGLRAITAAISTPYLKSQEQADHLVELFLKNSLYVANARVRWEPMERTGPDRSRKAKELLRAGQEIPFFEWRNSSESLRSLVHANQEKIRFEREEEVVREVISGWRSPEVHVPEHRRDDDGCVRVRKDEGWEVRLRGFQPEESISWYVLSSEEEVYNLLGSGTRFAGDAPRWIRWKRSPVGGDRPWLRGSELRPFLDSETGWGTIRVVAEAGGRTSGEIVIRVSEDDGFLGAVQESFQLPYVLGGSRLASRRLTGSDLALGGDCANLAVYALRRTQRNIGWKIPREFRALTQEVDAFTAEDVKRGVFIDLGTHLAVLMKDLPPIGQFNDEDLVAHHLEAWPELISLGQLLEGRRAPRYCRLQIPDDAVSIVLAGDTMLARTVGDALPDEDPFQGVRSLLGESDLSIVNLECGISVSSVEATKGKPFVFSAPVAAAKSLSDAGIDCISLANNHSSDVPLADTLRHLRGVDLLAFGHPKNNHSVIEVEGFNVAMIGWQPGDSFDEIEKAKSEADFVIVMPHWGTEYQREVDDSQSVAAKEMAAAGADLVVGAGPHCVQKSDRIEGVPVYYSLGNFVFDEDGPNEDWKKGLAIRVIVSKQGKVLAIDEIPVCLNERGFPTIPQGKFTLLLLPPSSPYGNGDAILHP